MTENCPKISVLLPVYNTPEDYLREAIESILKQTYTDFELIIINDGSTNNAESVIRSYTDERIRYFKQDNRGLIDTLNCGISICRGAYIARMDADDISCAERFAEQVNILDHHPQIGVVGCWIKYFPKEDVKHFKEYPRYLDLLGDNVIAHPAVMIRKSVLDRFDVKYANYLYAEDYELWSRLIRCCEFYNIQKILLNYRKHPASISAVFAEDQLATLHQIKNEMLDFLTEDKKLQKELCRVFNYSRYSFLQKIFSLKNQIIVNKKCKVITLFGWQFYLQKKEKKLSGRKK